MWRLALRFPLRTMARAGEAKGLRLLLRSAALWLALLGSSTATASKAVMAHLAAKWPETPLLLEARWVPWGLGPALGRGSGRRDPRIQDAALTPSLQGPPRSSVNPGLAPLQ